MNAITAMRVDYSIAEWKCAQALLDEYGMQGAVNYIQEHVLLGLSEAEAELLIHHVYELAHQALGTNR